jgi:pyruvate/2-oxoglutarate dehydrogenase complex dihydrolipoamide dehydrogenase (E3) component
LNTEVTVDLVERERPDVLVVATGAQQFFPPIPGVDGKNVVGAWDVLLDRVQTGQRVVFIGGEEVACEAADYVSEDSTKEVTVTSLLPGFATKGHVAGRRALANLQTKDLSFIPAVKQYLEINDQGVRILDASGAERFLPADTVVIAAGAKPVNRLAQELVNTGLVKYSIFTIGDAKEARAIKEAMHEGAVVAQHI